MTSAGLTAHPDILIRLGVSKYRVLDFLKIDALMNETVDIKDELKRQVEKVLEASAFLQYLQVKLQSQFTSMDL